MLDSRLSARSEGSPVLDVVVQSAQTSSAASPAILNETQQQFAITPAQKLREYLLHYFLRFLMFGSWFPGVFASVIAFFDPKIEIDILEFMQKLGPYAMSWMQLMSAGSALVLSSGWYAGHVILKHPQTDLNYVPFDFFPLLRLVAGVLDPKKVFPVTTFIGGARIPVLPAGIFTSLNFFIFVTAGIVQARKLERDNKFFLDDNRLALKPATLTILDAWMSTALSLVITVGWMAAKAAYSRCHQSVQTTPSVATNRSTMHNERRENHAGSLNGEAADERSSLLGAAA